MSKYKKIAFVFPGQGSQYTGMGQDFFDHFSSVKETFQEADDILGRKISSIILQGPDNLLTETKNSQTGIFITSIAMLRAITSQFPNLTPSVTAGLSLGEYTALTASNRLSFATCLPIVQHRGQYMNDACEKNEGTMAVVLGLDSDVVIDLVKKSNMPNELFVANLNCPGQVVISGTKAGIEVGAKLAKEAGAKRVLPLAVYGAFHSGLMLDAKERLSAHIHAAPLQDSTIEFVMNVPGDFVKDLTEVRQFLISQVTQPVLWQASVKKMVESSVDLFVEIGCGKTLSTLIKRSSPETAVISIEKLSDLELLAQI